MVEEPSAVDLVEATSRDLRDLAGDAPPHQLQRLRTAVHVLDLVARELRVGPLERPATSDEHGDRAALREDVRARVDVDAPGYAD